MNIIVIRTSDKRESPTNTSFPRVIEVFNEDDLKEAVSHDYCPFSFRDGQRSKAGFIEANCIAMDIDNLHSEDPSEWKTPIDVAKAFPSVQFYVHNSRNNMKEKDGRAPRPKFHISFPSDWIRSAAVYESVKKKINEMFSVL